MRTPKLSMLPPRAVDGPWYAAEVRRIAIRILVARLGMVSGALAGAIVAVMACGVVLQDRFFDDMMELDAGPTRAALWELFQRAGLAEALIATPLTIAVVVYALRATNDEGTAVRSFFASLAAAAAHVVLWPLMIALVSAAFDVIDPAAIAGSRDGGLNVSQFVCPVLLLFGPLGVGFGIGFMIVTAILRAWLHPSTGRTLLAARCLALVVIAVGLAALQLLASANDLEPYWLAVPTVILGATFVVDLVLTLSLAIRGRRWLSDVRAGRVPEWRLVPVSLAYVGDDLAPLAPSEAPLLALVRTRAPTYRELPEAVTLVPAR